MRPWNEIIAEARDRNKEKAERERRLKIAKTNVKGSAALDKGKKSKKEPYGPGNPSFDLAAKREKRKNKQLKFSIAQAQKNAEERKKKQLDDIKNKPRQSASAALSDIKTQSISSKDSDATAYTKVVGNVGSLVGGVAKAGIGYAVARHQAKKEADAIKNDGASRIPEKKPKKSGPLGGRPPSGGPPPPPSGGGSGPGGPPPPPPGGSKKSGPVRPSIGTVTGPASNPKRSKKSGPVRPSIGTVTGPASNPKRSKKSGPVRPSIGAVTGPASNPKRSYNEEYSNWREEFIFEVEDKTDNKKEKKKIIDVLPSNKPNKVELNPNMKEEKDQEGGMAHNELATMERAVKTLRKKIKSPNQQLPAWVQSKISKAVDHIDSVADYMSGETEKVTEGYDEGDETFRQHSRETFASQAPSERRSRTASVLKKMKELNANVEKPKKKKKKKEVAVAEECGCESDKKKVLMMAIIKKAVDVKKKKNSQLNSGIIGEESAAWQRKEGKNPEGGLNKKGIASYRRENPGSKLSLAVTTPPSKLDPDSKSAKRRKSFCARMGGVPGPMKDEKGRPTRKALSLRKWNC